MDRNTLLTATNVLKNAGCTEIYLFGSQATGHAHLNSDIDLGVKGLAPSRFFQVHFDLEQKLSMPVDLVDFDHQSDFFSMLQEIGEVKEIG